MKNLPPLTTLKAFSQAAALGSFTAAAAQLHVTHSAISHQIRQLETWLGSKIFIRSTSGVTLTDSGRLLYSAVAQSFDILGQASAEIRHNYDGNTINLACPGSFLLQFLIPRLYDFEHQYPNLILNIQIGKCTNGPSVKKGDALIYCGHAHTPNGIVDYPLAINKIGPVCAPAEARHVRTPADLLELTLLGTKSYQDAWETWAEAYEAHIEKLSAVRIFDQFIYLIQAAIAGLGIGIVPAFLVQDEILDGRLVAPLGFVDNGDRISLWASKSEIPNKQILLLIAWLKEILKTP